MPINTDVDRATRVFKGLMMNVEKHGQPYCPCKPEKSPDTICPCKTYRTQEICVCGLFS